MPILNDPALATDRDEAGWVEPDDVPRSTVTYGFLSGDLGSMETEFHRHRKSQLILLMHGVLSCELEDGLWIVPPQSALWVPGDVLHNVRIAGAIEGYSAFIEPDLAADLPRQCCAISVTPLLRELLIRSASFPLLYPQGGVETHLVTLLLDEIAAMPTGNLHLPMPRDARLRKLAQMLNDEPAAPGNMQTWAHRAGLSERTMARLLNRETGMSFGRWRQQIQLMLAVKWLGTGVSVQQVADDLGYESAGSFVTMFRKALGTSPGRYMAQRRGGG